MLARLLCALPLLPAVALGQAAALDQADLSRGPTLPPTSAAWVDEAVASEVNPAGLLHLGGLELDYLHEHSEARRADADAIYLGASLFHALALGFNLDSMRSAGPTDYRKSSWTLAVGGPSLSVGASLNLFSRATVPGLSGLDSFDLGAQWRPWRQLSVGASLKNVNQPTRGALTLPRKLDVGVGLRPWKERLTLGLDYLYENQPGLAPHTAQLSVAGEVYPGVVLSAGVARGFGAGGDWLAQLALTVNSAHLGATFAEGHAPGGFDEVVMLRASQADYPELALPGGTVALWDLSTLLTPDNSINLFGLDREDRYLAFTRLVQAAAQDPQLKGILLEISSLPDGGLGKAEELRGELAYLRAHGKKVIALLVDATDDEYDLATGADAVFAIHGADLFVNGLQMSVSFLGEAMDKLGVHWDVARVGRFKNAPDQLTRSSPSPAQSEAVNALLDSDEGHYESAVEASRHLSADQLHAAFARGLLAPAEAKQLGLVDGVVSLSGLDAQVRRLFPGAHLDRDYQPPRPGPRSWGARRRIAVVPVIGDIARGKSRQDPFGFTHIAGADTVVHALKEAQEDPRVAAIVLRVDSPGGDSLGSDLIYRAVLEARRHKPVVASMGDYAASGGYYASAGAEEIFAEPSTLTGSIGIFVLKPAFETLAQRLGITHQAYKRGPLTDMMDLYEPWTPQAQAAAQHWADAFYDDFLSDVAASRRMPKAAVDAVAQGRIWSGSDAKARGLVDRLGGILDAVTEARRLAGVPAGEDLDLSVVGNPHSLFASLGGEEGGEEDWRFSLLPATPLPPGLRELSRQLGLPSLEEALPGAKAQLPFRVRIQ